MTASRKPEFAKHSTTYDNGYTVENYKGETGPEGSATKPPNSLSHYWPTGFAGGGWCVKDTDGNVVFAHAFRVDCLKFAGVSA